MYVQTDSYAKWFTLTGYTMKHERHDMTCLREEVKERKRATEWGRGWFGGKQGMGGENLAAAQWAGL